MKRQRMLPGSVSSMWTKSARVRRPRGSGLWPHACIPAAVDIVPASVRACAIGVLNLLGATVSGFAPFPGGAVRRDIGGGRLMGFTCGIYRLTGLVVVYGSAPLRTRP